MGTGASHPIRTGKDWEKNNMADEESDEEGFNSEAFDVTRDLLVFLASVLDKAEHICENDVDEGTAEAHAEVIDQSLKRCRQAKHDSYSRDEGSVTVSKFSFNEYIF